MRSMSGHAGLWYFWISIGVDSEHRRADDLKEHGTSG